MNDLGDLRGTIGLLAESKVEVLSYGAAGWRDNYRLISFQRGKTHNAKLLLSQYSEKNWEFILNLANFQRYHIISLVEKY